MGCSDGLLVVVAITLLIFDLLPHQPGPAKTGFGFVENPFCLTIYELDGRHTTEQILFHHVTPIWHILRQTMTLFDSFSFLVYFFYPISEPTVHRTHLTTAPHLSSKRVGTLERQGARGIWQI